MVNLDASVLIERRPDEVFDYVADVTHDVEWRTGVVEAAFDSDDPVGVGAKGFDRIEANDRSMMSTWTVYAYVPGSHARWNLTSGPIRGTGGYICEPAGSETRFTLEARVRPTGWYVLFGPVFGMIGRRQNAADVEKLKRLLEDRPVEHP